MLEESIGKIDNMVDDAIMDRMDDRVSDEVEKWFSNEFILSDHVDIDDMVREVVEDRLRKATITVDL
jgi:hypothetical protein